MLGLPWFMGNSRYYGHMWDGSWQYGGGFAWMIPLAIWSAVWTGIALWHAARREQKGWFIFFLLVHSAGILEILYLIFVAHAFGTKKSERPAQKRRRR